MSNVEMSKLSKQEHDELCCTYASLLLSDESLEITEEHLKKIIDASGNKVDAMWPKLFAKALKGIEVSNLFGSSVAAAAAPAGSSAAPVQAKQGKKEAEKPKEQPKEEPKEEEDMDMGDLFAF